MKVRTRFAPSPTGFLHVGGIRTALFAYVYAKQNGGQFILRIEDTDKAREVEGSIEHIQESLKWLGLEWDEGPIKGGDYAPYVQSERLEIYKKWAEKLLADGSAYVDTFSKEEVDEFRQDAKEKKKAFLFRDYRPDQFSSNSDWYGKLPLRFKIKEPSETNWHDEVWGDMHAGREALDDFVLIKADGYPTYNFAHVIDDHLMKISHVMRGEEFLPSVPNYIALHKALGFELPAYVTMPAILASGGKRKLSKRDGAKDLLEYRDEGYLANAVFNFIASLGWNDGTDQEIYSPNEIIEKFSVNRIQNSGAQFDEAKLEWVNWQHIKRLAESDPLEIVKILEKQYNYDANGADTAYVIGVLPLALSKANSPKTLVEQLDIFTSPPFYGLSDENLKKVDDSLNKDLAKKYLHYALDSILDCEPYSTGTIETMLRADMSELDAKPRAYLNLIRWVVSGSQVSPTLFEMLAALGKEETIKRINHTLKQ